MTLYHNYYNANLGTALLMNILYKTVTECHLATSPRVISSSDDNYRGPC